MSLIWVIFLSPADRNYYYDDESQNKIRSRRKRKINMICRTIITIAEQIGRDCLYTVGRKLTFNSIASNEWITGETRGTAADWIMIDYFANGVLCARSRGTWVHAFLVNASLILRTFGTNNTFRSTIWWHSNITRLAWAHRMLVHLMANAVGSANIRGAYVSRRTRC